MRSGLIAVIVILLIIPVRALSCTADSIDRPGVCLTETYKFFNFDIHKACYFDPTYSDGDPWPGYEVCYATIRTGNEFSNKGTPLAEVYSAETSQLIECENYNTEPCDVFSSDGFTLDDDASDRGFCDASDKNCVKCNINSVEVNTWTGGGWILGNGDGYCESGCGAYSACDEENPSSWSNNQVSAGSPLEAHCDNNCQNDINRCRADFGADIECDYETVGTDCSFDVCMPNKTLIDYNGNHILDNTACQSDCTCDTIHVVPVCQTSDCGAHINCDGKLIGFNNGHEGCNNVCDWNTCDPYAWDEGSNECYTSCDKNSDCYTTNDYVCDLVDAGINTCVIDNVNPIVSINYPFSEPYLNVSLNLQYTVTDEVDEYLDCFYIVDCGTPISMGSVSQGVNNQEVISDEGWHDVRVDCVDDSNNKGSSNVESWLFDESHPTYEDFGWTNATVLHPSGIITFLDDLVLHAYWTDNFYLGSSVVYTNKTGEWTIEGVVDHVGPSEDWSNVTIDLQDYGNTTINYKIVSNDSAGNYFETGEDSFYVWNYTTDISVDLNDDPNNGELEFTANGQPSISIQPIDSKRTMVLGDFKVTHEGVGLPIDMSFRLDEALDSDFTLKLNTVNDYASAITLTTSPQTMCTDINPSGVCEVWIWLDWTGEESPGFITNNILVESFI